MAQDKSRSAWSAGLDRYLDFLKPMGANSDVTFAVGVCVILAILFVPLPTLLLDLGLALSFAVAIVVLMVALWVRKPLDFSSFPTLLLVVTVLRLSLSVASTRLILSEGHTGTDAAGNVIQGIANFVVGGDYVIGAIIFAILLAINFIVITKGSSRIAEVGARFKLDSMPGRQMAIDADLNNGLIDEAEAKIRRKEVEGESDFFGSMDGAAKFVRGDAVAGLIITGVNIVGGLLIGVMRNGMDVASAAQTYTVLTIGDGLVAQIPALIVSIAAGIIVTRGSVEGTAGAAVTTQLTGNPAALYVGALLVGGMGLLPGFPFAIFALLGGAIASMALLSGRSAKDKVSAERDEAARKKADEQAAVPEDTAGVDAVRVELGSSLVMMINGPDAVLPGQVRSLRGLFEAEFGFTLPEMRVRDNPTLSSGQYRVLVQDVPVAQGEIVVGSRLLIDPKEEVIEFHGKRVQEPTFGLSALWIDSARGPEAEAAGYTVVDPESVIVTHLTEVVKEHMPELLSYVGTQRLLKALEKDYQKLAADIPVPAPAMLVQQVLQRLLSERVSIRNLPLIIEAMAEAGPVLKGPDAVTEHVRQRLAAQICATIEDKQGFLPVMVLGQKWENEFAAATKRQDGEIMCMLPSSKAQEFVLATRVAFQAHVDAEYPPALLVSPDYRAVIRSMLTRVCPQLPVLSHGELHRRVKLRTVSSVGD